MVKDALVCMKARRSAREFTSEKVSEKTLLEILEAVRFAPSSKNSQPWKLTLVEGPRLETLRSALCEAFDNGEKGKGDFSTELLEVYRARAISLGKALLIHKGIERTDKEARRLHDRKNFEFFGAQQLFLLSAHFEYTETTLFDLGIFSGYLMLALENKGLASCPQVSILCYADKIRRLIPELKDEKIALALPFGYAKNSPVNAFISEREELPVWFRRI